MANPFEAFAFQAGARPAAAAAAAAPRGRPAAGAAVRPAKRARTDQEFPSPPGGLPEKLGDAPLRLMLVGHNPSEHAWMSGHYYSNPGNHMWRILSAVGIAPPASGPAADDALPAGAGVGFTDVGAGQPGTDSSGFTSADFQRWRAGFYARLAAHARRASASIGCACGACGAPALVAFTGKRHYVELLNLGDAGALRGAARTASSAVALGPQPPGALPPGWPLPRDTEVWVLSSTSGASALTNQQRAAPYEALAQRLAQLPWPRTDIVLRCGGGSGGGQRDASDADGG
ncbi:Tdg [Scenedesmus sp. PABB004]|nr:Tdg [Scenedesmus sp. PABB004]